MKKIRSLIVALLTLVLSCTPVLAASNEDTLKSIKETISESIRESDGTRQTFPVDTLRLCIPEMASEDSNTRDVRIFDVDEPEADKPLDEWAKVSALVNGKTEEWQVPVVWLDKKLNVVEEFRAGSSCEPVVVFSLPDGCTFDGVIDLDPLLAELMEQKEGILALSEPRTGIIYILGASLLPKNTGDAGRAENACGERICAYSAPVSDSAPYAVPSYEPADRPAVVPSEKPADRPADEPTDELADEPEDPSVPEPEPVDERTPLEIFADKYRGNYKNIDWAAEEENLGGNLADIDWAELIRLVGYVDFSVIQNSSGLREYYNSVKDDPDAYYDDLFMDLVNARDEFLDEKSERAESASDSLKKHIQPKNRQMVLGIYDHDDLEALVDVLIHRVQPKAINLLMNNFQAFSGAGAEAFSSATGLKITYSEYGAYGVTDPEYNEDQQITTRIVMTLEYLESEYDGSEEHIDPYDLDDEIIYTLVHENMHLIMLDYNRSLTDTYYGVPITSDDDGIYYFYLPDYGKLTDEEYYALREAKNAPRWFDEGIANAVGGFYATESYYKAYQPAAIETEDGICFDADKLHDDFSVSVRDLYDPKNRQKADFCYGPIAIMYMGELVLRHDGNTAITRDENGQVTRIDSRALCAGVSTLIESMHKGEALDSLVVRYTDGTYADTDDFSHRFIVGDENGRNEDSLQFTVDILNYLEKISREQGKLASGSILVDFGDSLMNYVNSDGEVSSDYYNFTDSLDYVPSDVSPKDAMTQGGKSEFDLEKFREEHKKENESLAESEEGTAAVGSEELPGGEAFSDVEEPAGDDEPASGEEQQGIEELSCAEVIASEEEAPAESAESEVIEEAPAAPTESVQVEAAPAAPTESVQVEAAPAAPAESAEAPAAPAAPTESVQVEAAPAESVQVEAAPAAPAESVLIEELPAA